MQLLTLPCTFSEFFLPGIVLEGHFRVQHVPRLCTNKRDGRGGKKQLQVGKTPTDFGANFCALSISELG